MGKLVNGMLAGLIATVVLSLLMALKAMMGLMPDVNVIAMLAKQMGGSVAMGWAAHFAIGVVGYGITYALIFSDMHFASPLLRGVSLALVGWLVMMLVLMPMMGAGLFGSALPSGIMAAVATLVLHVIFGAVLGAAYAKLSHR